jgi:hypothetical protein
MSGPTPYHPSREAYEDPGRKYLCTASEVEATCEQHVLGPACKVFTLLSGYRFECRKQIHIGGKIVVLKHGYFFGYVAGGKFVPINFCAVESRDAFTWSQMETGMIDKKDTITNNNGFRGGAKKVIEQADAVCCQTSLQKYFIFNFDFMIKVDRREYEEGRSRAATCSVWGLDKAWRQKYALLFGYSKQDTETPFLFFIGAVSNEIKEKHPELARAIQMARKVQSTR